MRTFLRQLWLVLNTDFGKLPRLIFGESDKQKVERLTRTRESLLQQRETLQTDLGSLLRHDEMLVERGKSAASSAVKKSVASELVQLRRDIKRQQGMVNVVSQQINIVGAELHNMAVMAQAKVVPLPNSEELAVHAAEAQVGLEELQASSELASTIEVGADMPTSEEEEAILREFEQVAESQSATDGGTTEAEKLGAAHSAAQYVAEQEKEREPA
jgi:hypothetical protein